MIRASQVALVVKNPPLTQETQVRSLCQEDPWFAKALAPMLVRDANSVNSVIAEQPLKASFAMVLRMQAGSPSSDWRSP